jgi:hypothetical protein
MKEFKPSSDFTAGTMRKIRAYEREQSRSVAQRQPVFPRLLRMALSGGGLLLGILNLVRLYLAVFSPVVCR